MSTDPSSADTTPPGCGLAVVGAGGLLLFAGLAFWIGFFVVEPRNFTLVFAALPLSALFTVLGATFTTGSSDLLLAWPIDAGLWLAIAFVASRWATRKGLGGWAYATVFLVVVAVALAYGLAMSLLVEPTS